MEDAPTVDQSLGDPIANSEGGQIPTDETKKVDEPKGAASSPIIDIRERSSEGERVSYKEKLAGNASFGSSGRQQGSEASGNNRKSKHGTNEGDKALPKDKSGRNGGNYKGESSGTKTGNYKGESSGTKTRPKSRQAAAETEHTLVIGSRGGETVRYTVQEDIPPNESDWAMEEWGDWREHPNDPPHYGALEDDMEEEYFVEYG
nr:hypothetical protein Iba_chr10aCG1920 [Ipomoea batatas]